MIPNKLDDWNFDIINDLINKNIGEGDRHDFKHNLPQSDILTKIACAFANTFGGFIIFGINEIGKYFSIYGIENNKELQHEFGQKTRVDPQIFYSSPKIIKIPGSSKIIAIFHIPLSPMRPHLLLDTNKRIFWKRTNRGNEQMTYEEIRMSFLNY